MGDCNGIYKMIDKIKKEIAEYSEKPSLSPDEWEMVFQASKSYKDLLTGCAMEESTDEWSERSSGRGRYYDGYSGRNYGSPMMEGSSGRGMRFSRGYSGHTRNELLDSYYDMLDEADNEEERNMIKRRIKKLTGDM